MVLLISLWVTLKNSNAEESTKPVAISAPRPEYPYAARKNRITGSGVCVMTVDPATGLVTRAEMAQSTGSPILDDAATSAFRQWKFKPGAVRRVRLPITFTTGGGVRFDPNRSYPYAGTIRAVNVPAHYITVQGPTGNDIILISEQTKLTKNSTPTDLRGISVGDQVHGLAKVTRERVAVALSANFTSRPKP
jgi:TonB family protein